MENTNKVTIDAAWFAELFRKANDGERIRKYCFECNIAKERDELKAKLVCAEREAGKCNGIPTEYRCCRDRLAAAERCIDNVKKACKNCKANINGGNYGQAKLNMDYCAETIRVYREQKESL